jgi:hypothetical protein
MIAFIAFRFRPARDIEPVAAPAFAVLRLASRRSTTFCSAAPRLAPALFQALTNSSTSSNVGGNPVKSSDSRRSNVRASASVAGFNRVSAGNENKKEGRESHDVD